MPSVDIGDGHVQDGNAEWVEVEAATDADMSTITLQLLIVNGERDGPTLWLQGGIHGNEPVGSLAVRDFALSLDPSAVSGTVIALPVSNPTAFANKQRGSQIRHIGSDDVNSVFPGDANGSFPQRLARTIFTLVRSHADCVINAHSADEETAMHTEFAYVPTVGAAVDESTREIGTASGIANLVELDVGEIPGFMTAELVKEDVPAIIVESGSGARVYEWAYDNYHQSFTNVARHLDICSDDPETGTEQTRYTDLSFLFANAGGFVEVFVEGGDAVETDESLAEVTDLRGEVRETVTAPTDGKVLAVRTFPTVRPGDLVVEMAPNSDADGVSNRPG